LQASPPSSGGCRAKARAKLRSRKSGAALPIWTFCHHEFRRPGLKQIRADAEAAARDEPALAPLLEEVFLRRASLEEALSVRLARKLAYHTTPESELQTIFLEAFRADPAIGRRVRADILAVKGT